ncbi:alpha/beta fold hydrolase [Limibacillus halophilus]
MRTGPRPLPLHLTTALMIWNSSLAAWPLWKSGSLPWSQDQDPDQGQASAPQEAERAARLREALEKVDPEAFGKALQAQVNERLEGLLDGIETYRKHDYSRDLPEMPLLWQEGSTRLLDYAPAAKPDAPVLLVVPSLVNRYYVLDLEEDRSFLRWLAAQGFRPLVIDWDAPGEAEKGFTLTDYIAGRLETALDVALEGAKGPVFLLGYCMGGLFTLALAQRRQRDLAGLVLMATPWNFHAEQEEVSRFAGLQAGFLSPLLQGLGMMPTDMVQSYFALLDPLSVLKKFLAFGRLDASSEKARRFMALEDWLNDGVPLTAPVALECLMGWYGANETAAGLWRIAGHPVDPSEVTLPTLALIPENDRIVPPASARALAEALPDCEIVQPALGHIGMVVAGRGQELVWEPLAAWLRAKG